jgi:hypothetical protein
MRNETLNDFDDNDIELFDGEDYQYNGVDGDYNPIKVVRGIDDFSDAVIDIDFSDLTGDSFKKSFKKATNKISQRKGVRKAKSLVPRKPLSKKFGVGNKAKLLGNKKQLGKIIVPDDRDVIVEGVSKFILSDKATDNAYRNIGYHKGKKLQELVFIFNNDSALDFNLSLFNPSMPLDYLYSTSQNLNDKIQVAGQSGVSYSDVLFNILANPVLIRSATIVISGPQAIAQQSVALQVQDKYINGVNDIKPINLSLQIDTMQVDGNMISFNINDVLNRPFIPDGMDVINYTILAGNTVTICFYHEQKSIKKLFYGEAREKRSKRF